MLSVSFALFSVKNYLNLPLVWGSMEKSSLKKILCFPNVVKMTTISLSMFFSLQLFFEQKQNNFKIQFWVKILEVFNKF